MPKSIQTYLKLAGHAYQKRSFADAERHLRQALNLDSTNVEVLYNIAAINDQQGKYDVAADFYRRALAAAPARSDIRRGLASLCFDQGDHDESRKLYADLIRANAADVDAHFAYSRLTKYRQNDETLDAIRAASDKTLDLSPDQRVKLSFALGKMYQDLCDYEKAFEMFTTGNELHYRRYPFDEQAHYAMLDDVRHCFDTDYYENAGTSGNASCAPIFVLGMPRSGSTLIEQILASHRDVSGAGELKYLKKSIQQNLIKDRQTFTNAIPLWTDGDLMATADSYLSKLQQHADGCSRVIDKMPGNFAFIGIIAQLFPNAKIIHTSRHPMATFWSNYSTHFSDALHFSYQTDVLCRYLEKYQEIMKHWMSALPANAFRELEYEKLVRNPEPELRSLFDYLDLSWDPHCLEFHRTKREVKTASVAQVRQPLYASAIDLWKNYAEQLKPYAKRLRPI